MNKILKNTLLKESVIYVMANIFDGLFAFFLLPYLTNYLTPEEYGVVSLFLIISKFFIPLINFNLNTKFSIDYYHENDQQLITLGNLFIIPVINTLIFFGLILFAKIYIQEINGLNIDLLLLIPLFSVFQFYPLIILAHYQITRNPWKYFAIKAGSAILNFSFSLFFITQLKLGVLSQVYGYIFGFLLICIYTIFYFKRKGADLTTFSFEIIKKNYRYGLPLIPYTISGIILSMSDRFFIQNFLGMKEVGVYSLAYQISNVLILVCTGITRTIIPDSYEKLQKGSKQSIKSMKRNIYFMMCVISIIAFIYGLLSIYFFDIIIDPVFSESKKYISIIIIGIVFQGFYMLKSNIVIYYKMNDFLSKLGILFAGINLILNWLLIKYFHLFGACLATVLTYFFLWISVWYKSWKIIG